MIRVSWVLRILLPWEVRAICGPPRALSVPRIFKLFASSTFRGSTPNRKHSTACPPLRTECPTAFENCFQTFTTFFRSWADPLDGRGKETDGVAVPIDRRTGEGWGDDGSRRRLQAPDEATEELSNELVGPP